MPKCEDASSRTSRSEPLFLLLGVQIFNPGVRMRSALLEGVRGDRDCALYYLGLTTGMRWGELLGVKWLTRMDVGNSRSSRP